MLTLLRDYKHLPAHYAPEIISASMLSNDGNQARIALRLREQKVKVVAIVLDAEYEIRSELGGTDRGP